MVMRNRSTPIAIRKSMAQHLVAMASADVRGYLDAPEPAPSAGGKSTKATRTPVKRIDTCELIEQAIDHGTTVSFDISSVTTRGETEVARMTLRPFAIKQRDGISYLLGTVYDARGADDTLRTVEIGRMRNVTTRLLDGKKLFAAWRRTTPPPHKNLRRPFDYPYRPSGSVLKNPPGYCKNGHPRYYSSTCTLLECSVSSHFYTGGNDMKDITISRRSLLVSAGLLALAPLAGCGGNSGSGSAAAGSDYTVGILQLTEHSALDAANDGFVKAIKKSGLKVKIDQKNAQNDQSTCKSIADKFVGDGVDLIYAIATPAAQAAAGATADIPIVGCAITDYAASGLVQDNDKPGTNVTGASDLTPVAEQLEMMQKVLPDVKKVACSTAPPSPTPTSRSRPPRKSSTSWTWSTPTLPSRAPTRSSPSSNLPWARSTRCTPPLTTPSPRALAGRPDLQGEQASLRDRRGGYVHGWRPVHPLHQLRGSATPRARWPSRS